MSRPDEQAGPPSIRWFGDRFVVVWELSGLPGDGAFQLGRADISPSGAWSVVRGGAMRFPGLVRLSPDGEVATSTWAASAADTCTVVVYDPDFRKVGETTLICGSDAPVFPLGGSQWLIAHGVDGQATVQEIRLARFDAPRGTLADTIGVGSAHSDQSLSVFAAGGVASVVWPRSGASIVGRVDGFGTSAAHTTEVRVAAVASGAYGAAELAGHRLLFGTDGSSLWAADITDPSSIPEVRTLVAAGIMDRPVGTAVASELGVVGVCYGTGSGPAGGSGRDGVAFVAVDADGNVVQGPVPIETGFENIGGCDVAWSGEEFAVAYWKIDWTLVTSELRVRRIAPTL